MRRDNRQRGDVETVGNWIFGILAVISVSVVACIASCETGTRDALLDANGLADHDGVRVLFHRERPFAAWVEGDEIKTMWLVPSPDRAKARPR